MVDTALGEVEDRAVADIEGRDRARGAVRRPNTRDGGAAGLVGCRLRFSVRIWRMGELQAIQNRRFARVLVGCADPADNPAAKSSTAALAGPGAVALPAHAIGHNRQAVRGRVEKAVLIARRAWPRWDDGGDIQRRGPVQWRMLQSACAPSPGLLPEVKLLDQRSDAARSRLTLEGPIALICMSFSLSPTR